MWQRYNFTNQKFEHSNDKGNNWAVTPNIPYLDAVNAFRNKNYFINQGQILFEDQTQPADARKFSVQAYGQALLFQTLTDNETVAPEAMVFDRTGNLKTSGWYYAGRRVVAEGFWKEVPFAASNFAGSGGGTWTVGSAAILRNRYTLVGKTMFWTIYVSWFSGSNTLAGAVNNLIFVIPDGYTTPGNQATVVGLGIDGGVEKFMRGSPSGNYVAVALQGGVNFAAGSPGIITTFCFEIN